MRFFAKVGVFVLLVFVLTATAFAEANTIDGENCFLTVDERMTVTKFDNFVLEVRNDHDYRLFDVMVEIKIEENERVMFLNDLEPGQSMEIDLTEVVNRNTLEKNFFTVCLSTASKIDIIYMVVAVFVMILVIVGLFAIIIASKR